MRSPGFWQHDGWLARLLSPLSNPVANATARRVAAPGWRAPVPVLCCGNASVGGTGKTTLALDLGTRLLQRGARVAFLTRGYRGGVRGPVQVGLGHEVGDVGDEALLLAALAPTFVGADRAASARAAVAAGATALVMDDGLQNSGLVKDVSLLVVDGGAGFGNGRVLPAGPLREPVSAAGARCQAAVLIGADAHHVAPLLRPPILRAQLRPAVSLERRRVLAFAGIGRPDKFFATVAEAGGVIAATRAFADHHVYTRAELRRLQRRAEALGAGLITTAKDAARLPPDWSGRIEVLGVRLEWANPDWIDALLDRVA